MFTLQTTSSLEAYTKQRQQELMDEASLGARVSHQAVPDGATTLSLIYRFVNLFTRVGTSSQQQVKVGS